LCTRRSWTSVADLRLSHKGFPGNFRRHHPTLVWRIWQFERLTLRSRLWLHARIVSGLVQIIDVINQVIIDVLIYFIVLIGYRPVGIRRLSSCATGACAIAITTSTATSTALFGSGNCRSRLWAEGRSLRGSVAACVAACIANWYVIGRRVASRIA
jgi:hypothetical protein